MIYNYVIRTAVHLGDRFLTVHSGAMVKCSQFLIVFGVASPALVSVLVIVEPVCAVQCSDDVEGIIPGTIALMTDPFKTFWNTLAALITHMINKSSFKDIMTTIGNMFTDIYNGFVDNLTSLYCTWSEPVDFNKYGLPVILNEEDLENLDDVFTSK
ncbi:uncharacterized protein LOC124372972 [Homalodisca vitripennis]|uniref:uncharacterized protein LOC124372972 n=1 Tax=Homalodisca vitripennis TaxID=197043 RepID=UPI001EEAB211|nr:uncharacterized protein LOC124372972 [Homalodisca vitripennis]